MSKQHGCNILLSHWPKYNIVLTLNIKLLGKYNMSKFTYGLT